MSTTPRTTENIIQILANLQIFLRKPIIRNKLSDFYSLERKEQIEIIELILDSIPRVNMMILEELMETWFEVLSKFESKRVIYILAIYLEEIFKKPDLIFKIIPSVIKTTKRLNEDNREILRICFIEALFNSTIKDEIVKIFDKQTIDFLNKNENIL